VAAVIVAPVLWAVASLINREYLAVVLGLGFALSAVGFVVARVEVNAGNVRPGIEYDESGTTLTADRRIARMSLVPLTVLTVTSASVLIFAVRHELHVPFAGTPLGELVFGAVFVLLFGSLLSVCTYFRKSVLRVWLLPNGYVIDGADSYDGEWADVDGVTARRRLGDTEIVLHRTDGSEHVIAPADKYTPQGIALFWMVLHYWHHPSARAELVNGEAVKRLAEERFPTD
jgi:hypothetical protein